MPLAEVYDGRRMRRWRRSADSQLASTPAVGLVDGKAGRRGVDGVVRWRRKDLARWLLETFAISLRELKALGFPRSRRGRAIELAPAGSGRGSPDRRGKMSPPPVWARRGTRPRARERTNGPSSAHRRRRAARSRIPAALCSRCRRCPPGLPPRSPELNRWRMSGNSARQLVVEPRSSNPTKTSSRCAAKPGTTSSTNHGRSCPSAPKWAR